MKTTLSIILCILSAVQGFSQDIIYTTDGKKEEVKVQEIKPNEIRYKKFSNPDGPDYVVPKSLVLLITYSNGTFESFGVEAQVKPTDDIATEYGKNYIAYNTFDLLLTNLTFSYERIIANGLIGLRVPVTMGFGNNNENWYNSSNINQGTIVASGLDINLYPSKQGRTRYFIAPSFLITSFNYTAYDDSYYDPYYYYPTVTKMGIQYAVMVKHGLLMQITPHFNMSCVLGLGLRQNETDGQDETNTKVSLEFNVGYKF